MSAKLYRLDFNVSPAAYDQMTAFLCANAPYGWEEKELPAGYVLFTLHAEDKAFLEPLASQAAQACPTVRPLFSETEKLDWVEAWKDFFTPVPCGSRFVILPPWLEDQPFPGREKIIIEPKSAFGTGHHASTRLCLTAISDLLDKKRLEPGLEFLDLGCGSGVLAIALAKSGLSGLGLDTDPLAVANARENSDLNGTLNAAFQQGGIEAAGNSKFDFIIANIMAKPLIELAPDIRAHLKPGGCLVLGGILDSQASSVEAAYAKVGFGGNEKIAEDEWRALIWP